MTRHLLSFELVRLAEGEATGDVSEAIVDHLSGCRRCQRELGETVRLVDRLRDLTAADTNDSHGCRYTT